MKNSYSLLEWNIHKMTKNITVKNYVAECILKDSPDMIVLAEYKEDNIIEDALQDAYFYDVAIRDGGNDILVAIKKAIICNDTNVVFDKYFFRRNMNKDQPAVLAATFTTLENEQVTIIGLRYIQGGNAIKVSKYLNQYLDGIKHPFICAGDFNILECRMPVHFSEYYHEHYDGGKESASVVMLTNFKECVVKDFNRLDHVIYNSNIQVVELNYSWDFTALSEVYIPYKELTLGDVWKVPPAYPDHAILKCKFNIK